MDAVEPAVGHDDHEIAVPALPRDGVDDVFDLRDVARVDARGLQVVDRRCSSGRFERKTAGSTTVSALDRARAKSDWKIRRQDVADRGSKMAQTR